MAVASFPNESTYSGNLFLIDLPTWKTLDLRLELSGWVSTMVFSPHGKQLAIAHGDTYFKLTMVDLEKGTITAQIPTTSYVSRLKFTQSGEALMLYKSTVDTADAWTAGPPQVLLLDAADLTPRWSAEVEEVRDGIVPRDENVTQANFYEPGNAFYISPGLVFAPDRDTLYIVHADSEKLTTVDFENQRVGTVEVQPRLTWFERLLSLTAGVAHAKIGDGITRQAAISPDGRYLYVVGMNSSTSQDQHGNWQMEQTPLGLEVIQTTDGSRLSHIETDTTELSLSPDGRFLYLKNWGNNQDNIPWTEILDTSSWETVARKAKVAGMPVSLVNGGFLLVSTYSTAETSHHMSVLTPDGSRVLAEWTAPTSIWWLTTP
jgi:WD40 repeat protein